MVSASLVQNLGIIQIHLLFLQQHNVIDITCITVKGFEAVKACKEIYLESYTSILGIIRLKLQEVYGKEVIEADRECCETGIDRTLVNVSANPQNKYAFLVVGDPFSATIIDPQMKIIKIKGCFILFMYIQLISLIILENAQHLSESTVHLQISFQEQQNWEQKQK